jgi:hypothetical protein
MNIIDAVKSGKRFKRKTHFLWNDNHPDTIYGFSYISILATDWEIEELKIQITEKELDQALIEVVGGHAAGLVISNALKKRLLEK